MTRDGRQQLRLRRFGLAAATFFIWASFMVYTDLLGLYELRIGGRDISVWWFVAGIALSNLLFFTLIVTDANLRFRDPSLTLPMMLSALVWAVFTAGAFPEQRAISFPAFMVVFLFGIFNLRAREYLMCWAVAIAGYAWMVVNTRPYAMNPTPLDVEWMLGLLLAAMLFWIAFFGQYVGGLRDKLAVRNNELKQALALVEELAVRDDLTGVHNRRFVMEMLTREQKRAERHGIPFSVLVLDLDRFKSINDTHGHAIGDEVLKAFVKRLHRAVRGGDVLGASTKEPDDTDTIGRFGGEEFIVVLPHTMLDGAQKLGQRIVTEVSSTPFSTSAGLVNVTVSIGVTEHRRGESLRELLERVDGAMYAAKKAGRDRIVAAPSEPDATPRIYSPVDN